MVERIRLPKIHATERPGVEQALAWRRSVREFRDEPLALEDLARLLWAAQGVTSADGLRAAPSAGATYPLEIYVVVGRVRGLDAGVYRYRPAAHELERVADGDRREALGAAASGQDWITYAPAVVVIAAAAERTAARYGTRAARYVALEAGHAAENVALEAVALGMGSTMVGAFRDSAVASVVRLARELAPLLLVPVGRV